MLSHLRASIVMTVLFTLLLGLAGEDQAGGSLVHDASGQLIGSSLIAQGFAKPEYLHPRESAAGNGYDPMSSGGTNLGPLDQKLIDRIKGDAASIAKDDGPGVIPPDAVTTSGSGLDPDVSPDNASPPAAASRSRTCWRSSTRKPTIRCWALSASRRSTCWRSIALSTRAIPWPNLRLDEPGCANPPRPGRAASRG
jgi:K+-transporting ATPase ATPase C chain